MTNFSPNEKLTYLIQEEIHSSGGRISFARFMELALYEPNQGYYMKSPFPLGKTGDFITSPEISPLFAQCVANQCHQILTEIPKGDILELGAGTGIFAKDLLLQLEEKNTLPTHYFIIEISPILQKQQQNFFKKKCPHLLPRIEWLTTFPKEGIKGIIFANEVLDALPVHCFQIEEEKISEKYVAFKNNAFEWSLAPPTSSILLKKIKQLAKDFSLPPHYESEINLKIGEWIKALATALHQGVIILIDYGYERREYYRPDRSQGTLMCFYQHTLNQNPFLNIGLQDITAHVDFTAVAETAIQNQLQVKGYTTQTGFLLNTGLLYLNTPKPSTPIEIYHKNQAIKKLTLPSQMGEVIKVMALAKNFDPSLLGFSTFDRRQDL